VSDGPFPTERDVRRFWRPDPFDQERDAIATPEQLAVEDHGRHAEHAE
jgi:hypothetical protein